MNKIEYLEEYCSSPEVIKVGAYKGVKYIVVMEECPGVYIQSPNIMVNGHKKLKELLQERVISCSRYLSYILDLPGFVPSQLEEPITNLYNGWLEIWFDGDKDYIIGARKDEQREKRTLEEVLEITCDCIDLIKKFHRVYRDYDLGKAYREIEEWEKQIKEAYEKLEQD